ncbi:putative membrane-anchored protein [Pedobacter sp. UYP30]|uniref:COG4705 family protein n=1 Tax=Pedobacter sp. UYP30 TaxID=1756400 RepID=UPI003397133A
MKNMLNKVPAVTLAFWIIKILATTIGETAADFLNVNLGLGLVNTSYVMTVLLIIVLVIQFRYKKYVPWIYWLVVVFISIMGTLISDNLVDNLGVSLVTTTVCFGTGLIIVFIAWYASEKTLSVHKINSTKREFFYWAAILFTFALGTSGGDLISERLGLGYPLAAALFSGTILLIFLSYKYLKLNAVLAFWLAYILTRPLGASIGDLLTQSPKDGGLGVSITIVNAVFLAVIIGLVSYLSILEAKKPQENLVVD